MSMLDIFQLVIAVGIFTCFIVAIIQFSKVLLNRAQRIKMEHRKIHEEDIQKSKRLLEGSNFDFKGQTYNKGMKVKVCTYYKDFTGEIIGVNENKSVVAIDTGKSVMYHAIDPQEVKEIKIIK